jgi:hypothetical protein
VHARQPTLPQTSKVRPQYTVYAKRSAPAGSRQNLVNKALACRFGAAVAFQSDEKRTMKVRCKMLVNGIERGIGSRQVIDRATGKASWVPAEQRTIKLHPVYGNGDPNHENTKLWNATPSGQFQFTMISLETGALFELNKLRRHHAGGLRSVRHLRGRMREISLLVDPAEPRDHVPARGVSIYLMIRWR